MSEAFRNSKLKTQDIKPDYEYDKESLLSNIRNDIDNLRSAITSLDWCIDNQAPNETTKNYTWQILNEAARLQTKVYDLTEKKEQQHDR